jgi:hypothetical protein
MSAALRTSLSSAKGPAIERAPVHRKANVRSSCRMTGRLREATAGFEPAIGVLQTPALPLGYVATTLEVSDILA